MIWLKMRDLMIIVVNLLIEVAGLEVDSVVDLEDVAVVAFENLKDQPLQVGAVNHKKNRHFFETIQNGIGTNPDPILVINSVDLRLVRNQILQLEPVGVDHRKVLLKLVVEVGVVHQTIHRKQVEGEMVGVAHQKIHQKQAGEMV